MTAIRETTAGKKFWWVTNGEPHQIRRREILNKHGHQIRKLYGYDHKTAWQVGPCMCFSLVLAAVRFSSFFFNGVLSLSLSFSSSL